MESIFAIRLDLEVPPETLEEAAKDFTNEVMEEIVKGPPPRHLVAFTVGPARPMRWELEGAPSPPDELIRALADHESAYVVGLVHPTAVPGHVPAERAWLVTVEDATRRVDVMIALRGSTDAGGAEEFQILQANPAQQSARWVGVPADETALVELGGARIFGPAGEA